MMNKKGCGTGLLFLCWLAYSTSYLGKVSWSANVSEAISYFSVSHSEAGMVGTLLFFAYGIGQVINGLFCKKYNIRLVVFAALTVSGICNLTVALAPDINVVKAVWLINGATLSVLWPSLIRLLSETLPRDSMPKASIVMGTTVASGTLLIYALSALFVGLGDFKLSFITSGIVMPVVALVWLVFLPRARKRAQHSEADLPISVPTERGCAEARPIPRLLILTVIFLSSYGIVTNLIKDGLISWTPSIFKESFGIDGSVSIVLTLLLPIISIFGNMLGVFLHKKIPDFVLQCALMFLVSGVLFGVSLSSLFGGALIPLLLAFAVICLLVASCNSIITGIFPLYMKGKVNSGLVAGLLNGFCYVGSTLSSLGLGLVVDLHGWAGALTLLLCVSVCAALTSIIYILISRKIKE